MKDFKMRPYRYLPCILLLLTGIPAIPVLADPTDEILDFTITVDVNEDASLNMLYHIDWEVLDDSVGELEWIDLGVPNRYHENITPLSDTIDHIEDKGSSLNIYLDQSYEEGETVSVDFSMTQDHMYQIDKWVEGETVYTFTPAWFDSMEVDSLTIRWNADDAGAWQPDCYEDDGYLVFETSLSEGDRYTISVTYPNDTFGFVPERQAAGSGGGGDSGESEGFSASGIFVAVLAIIIGLGCFVVPIIIIVKFVKWFAGGAGFGSDREGKKITRTMIEYYPNCPNCGAPREEGKDSCPYCGRSMIKKKEVVEESEIENPEKYTKNGTYRYGNSPNTFIFVNVASTPSSRTHTRSSGGSHHSSCASSCACACACASSGRAGCTVKDFFKRSIHEGRVRVRSHEG